MSGSSKSNSEHHLNADGIPQGVRDVLQLYFRKDEAKTLAMKVTVINHTLDYLKIGLAAATTGFTVFKADFTAIKIDEKGVSWLGNTRWTFPWANPEKEFWRKVMPDRMVREFDAAEEKKEKAAAELRELKEQPAKLRNYVDRTFYKASHATHLDRRIDTAKRSADRANRDIATLRTQLRSAAPGELRTQGVNKQVAETRSAVNRLSQALAGI